MLYLVTAANGPGSLITEVDQLDAAGNTQWTRTVSLGLAVDIPTGASSGASGVFLVGAEFDNFPVPTVGRGFILGYDGAGNLNFTRTSDGGQMAGYFGWGL